jgi:hypothetical protein
MCVCVILALDSLHLSIVEIIIKKLFYPFSGFEGSGGAFIKKRQVHVPHHQYHFQLLKSW